MIEEWRKGRVGETGPIHTPHLATGDYDFPDGDWELQRSMDRSVEMEETVVVLKLRQKLLREHFRVTLALRFFRWFASLDARNSE